jgi:hypothetical protein
MGTRLPNQNSNTQPYHVMPAHPAQLPEILIFTTELGQKARICILKWPCTIQHAVTRSVGQKDEVDLVYGNV